MEIEEIKSGSSIQLNVSGNIDTFSQELLQYQPFMDKTNLIKVCPTCHKEIHLKDNPELSQYLLES